MNKYLKGFLDTLFLGGLIAITTYFTLKGRNPSQIINSIQDTDPRWIILGFIFVLVFICGESVIMKYLYHVLGDKIKLIRCIKYSFIGFFFSCVTPSASGGQPMQLYHMGKDKNKVSDSCLVLLIITIGYKSALVLMSIILFIFQGDFIVTHLDQVVYILAYGIVVNVIFIAFLFLLIFKPSVTNNIVKGMVKLLYKLHLVKKRDALEQKLLHQMESYKDSAEYIKSHENVFFNVLWMSILQRSALFLVTWCVYRSFGLHGISAIKIVALQTIIALSVDMLPLPGGVGAAEKSFAIMFDTIFGLQLVIPGMILTRGISYYFLLLITGIVTVFAHLMLTIRDRNLLD